MNTTPDGLEAKILRRHFNELTAPSALPEHEWKAASITDRQRQRGGQRRAEHHRPSQTPSGLALPSLSPLPSLLSSAPVSQLGGRGLRGDNGSVLILSPSPRGGEGRSESDSAVASACSPREVRGARLGPRAAGEMRWRSGGKRSGEGAERSLRSGGGHRAFPTRRREGHGRAGEGRWGKGTQKLLPGSSEAEPHAQRAAAVPGSAALIPGRGMRWAAGGGGTGGCAAPQAAALDRSCSRRVRAD